jgi:hypothetical protein
MSAHTLESIFAILPLASLTLLLVVGAIAHGNGYPKIGLSLGGLWYVASFLYYLYVVRSR